MPLKLSILMLSIILIKILFQVVKILLFKQSNDKLMSFNAVCCVLLQNSHFLHMPSALLHPTSSPLHHPTSLLFLFYLSSSSPPSLKKPEPLTMWGCLSRVYLATLAPDGELILLAFQQEVGPHLEQEPAQVSTRTSSVPRPSHPGAWAA